MKRYFLFALVLASCLTASPGVCAQAPADSGSGQSKPAAAPQAVPSSEANPFPEDTSNVPVMPSKGTPTLPAGTDYGEDAGRASLPSEDLDPVRSPDDPVPAAAGGQEESSSTAGMDKLLPPPDDDTQPDKNSGKRRLTVKEPTHQEAASEDINVGGYYLDKKNWKAALSRFESAMVLDPENPDVYWGLAEADRHLGALVEARGYYQKVVDYDPDSKHGKDARKALKDPEIANAKPPAVGQMLAGGSRSESWLRGRTSVGKHE